MAWFVLVRNEDCGYTLLHSSCANTWVGLNSTTSDFQRKDGELCIRVGIWAGLYRIGGVVKNP